MKSLTLRPEAVFIDAGGVLILPDLVKMAQRYAVEVLPRAAYLAFFRAFAQRDAGRPEDEWLWEAFGREIGAPSAAIHAALRQLRSETNPWIAGPAAAPGAIAFLRKLEQENVNVVVISNSDYPVDDMLLRAGACQMGPGPLPSVLGIVDSHIVGVAKPDPRIFDFGRQILEVHTGEPLDFSRCCHIGDAIWSDVRGAQNAGIPVFHLDPEAVCLELAAKDHDHVATLEDAANLILFNASS